MKLRCFVMMPSGNHNEYDKGPEEADFIFSGIIVPALHEAFDDDVKIHREVDNKKPGAITGEIIRHIAESDVAIVDITGENPNVFLELGMRYALRRSTTLLLRQGKTPIPFDIKNYRCIDYKPIFTGVNKAKDDIVKALAHIRAEDAGSSKLCDSLVFEVFPHLDVVIPSVDGRWNDTESNMPWPVFKDRIERVKNAADSLYKDGRYVPAAVIGITNGGAMFADLLSRELFGGAVPVVSLWANRLSPHGSYFDNELNEAMVSGLQKVVKGSNNANILLVDDIVASGTTQKQAIKFLQDHLPGIDIRFLPLFSRNKKYFELVEENLLWLHPVFNMTEKEIFTLHDTDWLRLPYDKDIRST
ncbi:MAG TPA: phosphoribosyltransferase [Pyrinomonadaceae bacterium]|nr:phosphoribosyltransferase [Pyrinomonadaceae bacterium]